MKKYLGVDLHRNCFTVCARGRDGSEQLRQWSIHSIEAFAKTVKSSDEVAVEATGNTRLFCDGLRTRKCRIVVVNPHEFDVISRSVKKTDENDAKVLAEFLSKDMLPEIRMKDPVQAQISSLVQTRDRLVKLRTSLKNKVNNLLASKGILIKKESLSSEKGLNRVLMYDMDEIERIEVEVIIEQIRHLNTSIHKLEKAIKEQGSKLPGHKNLTSIKGIGDVSASIMLSTIGDVNDFPDEGKLAAYFGIVPRVGNSNETERSGRITKRGNKLARTALVQCSLIAMRYNPYLQAYYRRMAARRGTGKAIIALSRKFLNIIYKTLKNDWVFEDFPRFVLVNG
jgi:transposase